MKHTRTCPAHQNRENKNNSRVLEASLALLTPYLPKDTDADLANLIDGLRETEANPGMSY